MRMHMHMDAHAHAHAHDMRMHMCMHIQHAHVHAHIVWSKPVNLGTWGLVLDPIAMAYAFAELGYGTNATMVHTTRAKTGLDVGTFFGPYPLLIFGFTF